MLVFTLVAILLHGMKTSGTIIVRTHSHALCCISITYNTCSLVKLLQMQISPGDEKHLSIIYENHCGDTCGA